MNRTLTCIVCPNGCDLSVRYTTADDGTITVQEVTGNTCPRGEQYAQQELIAPMRTIASSCTVTGGELPVVSVRLNNPIPKARIFDVCSEIQKVRLEAPVHIGDVVIADVLGLGSDVIVTKNVEKV